MTVATNGTVSMLQNGVPLTDRAVTGHYNFYALSTDSPGPVVFSVNQLTGSVHLFVYHHRTVCRRSLLDLAFSHVCVG